MTVKIRGQWKKDDREYNGLESIAGQLLKKPLEDRYAVLKYRVGTVEIDVKGGGTRTPKIDIEHIEPLDGDDADAAEMLMDKLFAARQTPPREPTGQGTLPFDQLPEDAPDDAGGPIGAGLGQPPQFVEP